MSSTVGKKSFFLLLENQWKKNTHVTLLHLLFCWQQVFLILYIYSITQFITKEESMYLRVVHLLHREACPAVRVKFNILFPPLELKQILQSKIQILLTQKGKKISHAQWNLLFPQSGCILFLLVSTVFQNNFYILTPWKRYIPIHDLPGFHLTSVWYSLLVK